MCLLALSIIGAWWITSFDDGHAGVIPLLQSLPYAAATGLVLKRKPEGAHDTRAPATILFFALVMRAILVPGTPISTDVFRYVWDGRVQGAGINPYLYLPIDAALSSLRDGDIYPYINRVDYAPTIYPPTAQIVFYLVTRVTESVIGMKIAMLMFEGLAIFALLKLLAARSLPPERILIYAWHPLPLWEFARSGHVDIVAIAFLFLGLLACEKRSPIAAGAALAAGVLVKYFPAATAPALYKRWDWRLPFAFAGTGALLYLPYIGAGRQVLGFLTRYAREEGLADGSGIFFWQLLNEVVAPPAHAIAIYFAAAGLILLVLAGYVLMRNRHAGADIAGAFLLAAAFMVLFSPHYSWYFAWLVPFLCFYPVIAVLYLTCAIDSLYFAAWPPTLAQNLIVYGPFLLMLIAALVLRWRQNSEARNGHAVPA
jgi:hypothetical protein